MKWIIFCQFILIALTIGEEDIYEKKLGPLCSVSWKTKSPLDSVNGAQTIIEFRLTCKTLMINPEDWIGFGISNNGAMKGADIVTIEFDEHGTPSLTDRFAEGNKLPLADSSNDYKLLEYSANNTHIYTRFERLLKTCDVHDIDITDDTQKLIWAIGSSRNLSYHGMRRGSIVVNLLDKQIPPPKYKGDILEFHQNIQLNGNKTLYSCRIHKIPPMAKHHITGYELFQTSSRSLKHAHHGSLLSCNPPNGMDANEFFKPYLNTEYDCYYPEKYFPTQYCKTFEFQWTYGGTTTTFPSDIGVPIGDPNQSQYYLSMFHINNDETEDGIMFTTGFDLFYTTELRPVEIGFLQLGINSSRSYSLTIPPNTNDYVLSSHCPEECTQLLPSEGINVFVYLLHFHLSGRKMKIRHFRNGMELPWIAKDDNYDTDYQMSRLLKNPIKILPRDHLTVECEFETKWLNGSTVLGGRSIDDEMCQAFLMYYPKVKGINRCGSSLPQDSILNYFGIENVAIEKAGNDPMITSPSNISGIKYSEFISGIIEWNDEKRAEYQNFSRYGRQIVDCYPRNVNSTEKVIYSSYPRFDYSYIPEDTCRGSNTLSTTDVIWPMIVIHVLFLHVWCNQ